MPTQDEYRKKRGRTYVRSCPFCKGTGGNKTKRVYGKYNRGNLASGRDCIACLGTGKQHTQWTAGGRGHKDDWRQR